MFNVYLSCAYAESSPWPEISKEKPNNETARRSISRFKLRSMVGQDVEVSDQHSQIPPFLYTLMGNRGKESRFTSYIYCRVRNYIPSKVPQNDTADRLDVYQTSTRSRTQAMNFLFGPRPEYTTVLERRSPFWV